MGTATTPKGVNKPRVDGYRYEKYYYVKKMERNTYYCPDPHRIKGRKNIPLLEA